MTNNEIIAEFLGIPIYEGNGEAITDEVYIINGGGKMLFMDNRSDEPLYYWSPEIESWVWHGDDGILVEINRRKLLRVFADELLEQSNNSTDSWIDCTVVGLLATPQQLSQALVNMIKEDSCNSE